MEATTAKPVSEVIPKTLEMLGSLSAPQTTGKPFDVEKRRKWLSKWLKLETSHSRDLVALENGIYDFCRDFSKRPARGHRLIIHGENGTGKSHCAKAVSRWAKRMAVDLPYILGDDGKAISRTEYVWWPNFCDELKAGAWDRVQEVMKVELLILDDIGAEYDPSRLAAEKLYQILERREWRWTLITTNVSPESWATKFERRIASRLLRNTKTISTENVPDYRTIEIETLPRRPQTANRSPNSAVPGQSAGPLAGRKQQ